MAADLLEDAGWTTATSGPNYIGLIGAFGGRPHLVGLATVGSGDHIVLVAPGGLRTMLEGSEDYVSRRASATG